MTPLLAPDVRVFTPQEAFGSTQSLASSRAQFVSVILSQDSKTVVVALTSANVQPVSELDMALQESVDSMLALDKQVEEDFRGTFLDGLMEEGE